MSKAIAMHGRDHRPGGADPIPGINTSGPRFSLIIFDYNEVITATAADEIYGFTCPSDVVGMSLIDTAAWTISPSASGDITLDLRRYTPHLDGSVDLFFSSGYLTIDEAAYDSLTSASVPTIDSTVLCNPGDFIRVKVRDAGTLADGLGVHFTFGTV